MRRWPVVVAGLAALGLVVAAGLVAWPAPEGDVALEQSELLASPVSSLALRVEDEGARVSA